MACEFLHRCGNVVVNCYIRLLTYIYGRVSTENLMNGGNEWES